jgi:hypothetical protein
MDVTKLPEERFDLKNKQEYLPNTTYVLLWNQQLHVSAFFTNSSSDCSGIIKKRHFAQQWEQNYSRLRLRLVFINVVNIIITTVCYNVWKNMMAYHCHYTPYS